MELAPGLGLSRLIVDLVQTGSTLRANGLVETEVIAPITSRLIVNRTALKTQPETIGAWIARFRAALGAMIRLATTDPGFEAAFAALLDQARETTESVDQAVAAIIADVRARGRCGAAALHRALRSADADRRSAAHRRRRKSMPPSPAFRADADGGAGPRRDADRGVSPPAGARRSADHGRRRPDARHALDAAGCGRPLRAGRQGRLSVVGADERDSGARRRRGAHRDVRADPGWRAEPAGARRRAPRRRGRDLSRRRRPGDRGAGLRHRHASRRWIGSSVRATPMSPRPSGRCSAGSASTRSPGPSEVVVLADAGERSAPRRRRPAGPGRARRGGAGDPDHRRCGVRRRGRGGGGAGAGRPCRAPPSPGRAGRRTARSSWCATGTRRWRWSTVWRRSICN